MGPACLERGGGGRASAGPATCRHADDL